MIYDEYQHSYTILSVIIIIWLCIIYLHAKKFEIHSKSKYIHIKRLNSLVIIVLYNKNDDNNNNNNRHTHTVYSVILYIAYRSIKYKICAFYKLQSLDV